MVWYVVEFVICIDVCFVDGWIFLVELIGVDEVSDIVLF